jgi:hypothetical protein
MTLVEFLNAHADGVGILVGLGVICAMAVAVFWITAKYNR